MMRFKFDEQLALLNEELITMGSLCEKAIATSARALTTGEFDLAEEVPELEAQINQKERDIETLCLKLLLQQQPVAKDLRAISSALKMITDMERIGDQASDIAEIITTARIAAVDDSLQIGDMADAAIKMVTDSIDAFVKKDVNIARGVIEYDDVVDKYFERIGDHAVNIAGWVLFSITGNREKE